MLNLCAFSLGFLSLFAVPQTHDKTFTPQEIHFVGVTNYSEADLIEAGGLKIGQSYSAEDLNSHAQQLLNIGIFDKVAYKFDNGILVYVVKASPLALPIQLGNLPLEPGEALEAKLHSRIPLYQGTVPSHGLLLEAVRQTLEEQLAAEGVQAQVGADLVTEQGSNSPAAVRFSIVSPPVKIGTLKLEGVSEYIRPQLDKIALLNDAPFDAEHSADLIERTLKEIYASHGFAAADVHAVRYGFPAVADGAVRVPYKVTVKEGRSYRLGSVKLAGNIPVDPVEIDRLMASRSTFMPESMFLDSLISQLETRLKGEGYLNCKVSLAAQVDATGVANYTVNADLGTMDGARLVRAESANGALKNLLRQ